MAPYADKNKEVGCDALIPEIVAIINDIVAAAGSDTDTNWWWSEYDYGVGNVGWTRYAAHPIDGRIRWDANNRPKTYINKWEFERVDTAKEFLFGVAHEARHWKARVARQWSRSSRRISSSRDAELVAAWSPVPSAL